jgi:hypothetical protein
VTSTFEDRYEQHEASSFEEAMAWIEERREAALYPFFEWLLSDARGIVGPDTLADS